MGYLIFKSLYNSPGWWIIRSRSVGRDLKYDMLSKVRIETFQSGNAPKTHTGETPRKDSINHTQHSLSIIQSNPYNLQRPDDELSKTFVCCRIVILNKLLIKLCLAHILIVIDRRQHSGLRSVAMSKSDSLQWHSKSYSSMSDRAHWSIVLDSHLNKTCDGSFLAIRVMKNGRSTRSCGSITFTVHNRYIQ